MLRVLEFLTGFYWILIPQFIIESLFRARWRDAYNSGGPIGIAKEGFGSALGFNAAVFYVDIYGNWSGRRIKKLLASYDIPMWGWGYAFEQFYFRVPVVDAEFAQKVMLGAGVDLLNY